MKKNKEMLNQNSIIFIGAVVTVLVLAIFIVIGNKQTYSNEENSEVTLSCPTRIGVGEEFECAVALNTSDILSVNATYVLPDNIEFVSFEASQTYPNEEGFVFETSETKFAIGYIDNLSVGTIGSLKLKMKNNDDHANTISIGLTEIELTYEGEENGESTVLLRQIDDVSSSMGIKSDVNTLDSLTLSSGKIKETFDSNVTTYTATVANNITSVNISATPTDENATISGTGTVSIHYGTQEFKVEVTSETGKVKTYNISIYRPYVLTTDYYIYNQDKNYIYTKNDYVPETIIGNLMSDEPSDVSYSVENNKLIAKYADEELLSIDIINFKTERFSIVDEKIYIGGNISYQDFMEAITLNKITMKVFDKNKEEITTGNIQTDYIISTYYDDTLLESYEAVQQYLNFDSSLVINDDEKIISRIKDLTTFEELGNKIDTSGIITFKSSEDEIASSNDIIGTGAKIIVDLGEEEITYTLSVLGDLTGDGQVNISDVSKAYRKSKNMLDLDIYYIYAGDVNNDGRIGISDVSRMYRKSKKVISSLEVE